MILEAAMLQVRLGSETAFEAAFAEASPIIAGMNGCHGHELQRCLEAPGKYLLLVRWEQLEDHTVGFRQSPQYAEWRWLLHHFYDPFPTVEHFVSVVVEAAPDLPATSCRVLPGCYNAGTTSAASIGVRRAEL